MSYIFLYLINRYTYNLKHSLCLLAEWPKQINVLHKIRDNFHPLLRFSFYPSFSSAQMYSGTFTHFIKPVLSTSQIEKIFGLLGYQFSSRHEQLRLQPARVSPASLGDLLLLSCACFLARCECRLLLTALGKHVGDTQWELSMVRERQKGNSLQVCKPAVQRWMWALLR